MKVFTRLPLKVRHPVILSIGNFDGMHRGHQLILQTITRRAKRTRAVSCVLTFSRHPKKVLHPEGNVSLITSPLHKLSLLARSGLDCCVLLPFRDSFAHLTPRQFVLNYLRARIPTKEVYLGYNARFGKHRSGTAKTMKHFAKEFDFGFHRIASRKTSGYRISSSLIRHEIERGRLSAAGAMLGRRYSIFADVVSGRRRGRSIGYPTANLNPHSEALPPTGVYLVRVNILRHPGYNLNKNFIFRELMVKKNVPAVLNLGFRPTFGHDDKYEIPEVHLINYCGHLKGKLLEVVFFKKLRQEKKFRHIEHLKNQIKKDVETADRYFRRFSFTKT